MQLQTIELHFVWHLENNGCMFAVAVELLAILAAAKHSCIVYSCYFLNVIDSLCMSSGAADFPPAHDHA